MKETLTTIINHENFYVLLIGNAIIVILTVIFGAHIDEVSKTTPYRDRFGIGDMSGYLAGFGLWLLFNFFTITIGMNQPTTQEKSVNNQVEVVTQQTDNSSKIETITVKEVIIGRYLKVTSDNDQVFIIDTDKRLQAGDKISIQLKNDNIWVLSDLSEE